MADLLGDYLTSPPKDKLVLPVSCKYELLIMQKGSAQRTLLDLFRSGLLLLQSDKLDSTKITLRMCLCPIRLGSCDLDHVTVSI